MKSRKSAEFEVAFVLDEQSLRRLFSIISPYSVKVGISVACSDGFDLSPASLEELLGLLNPTDRQITNIKLENHIVDSRVYLRISIGASRYRNVRYELTGEQADVRQLEGELIDWLSTVRQWYTPLAASNSVTSGVSLALFLVGSALAIAWHFDKYFDRARWIIAGYLILLIAYANGWVRRQFFPAGMFAIGDGVRRCDAMRERRRAWSVIGIVLAIATGIAGTLLTKWFGL